MDPQYQEPRSVRECLKHTQRCCLTWAFNPSSIRPARRRGRYVVLVLTHRELRSSIAVRRPNTLGPCEVVPTKPRTRVGLHCCTLVFAIFESVHRCDDGAIGTTGRGGQKSSTESTPESSRSVSSPRRTGFRHRTGAWEIDIRALYRRALLVL